MPKPTVVSKKVSFTIRITCSSHPAGVYDNRQMVVDLMGDDPVGGDDVMKYSVKGIWDNRSYSYSFSGWPCNEDVASADELYLRVRTEKHEPGGLWRRLEEGVVGSPVE